MKETDKLFLDVILLMLVVTIASLVLLIPWVHPVGKLADNDIDLPGNVIVEIEWPYGWDTDVDLWVRAPGDIPVGYSSLSGKVFNLLRDDLGRTADISQANYENAYSRGLLPGEYIINIHLYGNSQRTLPVPVRVKVWKRIDKKNQAILDKKFELLFKGHELTVIRFFVDEKGIVQPDSINDIQFKLRSRSKIGS